MVVGYNRACSGARQKRDGARVLLTESNYHVAVRAWLPSGQLVFIGDCLIQGICGAEKRV
jgi:hypothetical protein